MLIPSLPALSTDAAAASRLGMCGPVALCFDPARASGSPGVSGVPAAPKPGDGSATGDVGAESDYTAVLRATACDVGPFVLGDAGDDAVSSLAASALDWLNVGAARVVLRPAEPSEALVSALVAVASQLPLERVCVALTAVGQSLATVGAASDGVAARLGSLAMLTRVFDGVASAVRIHVGSTLASWGADAATELDAASPLAAALKSLRVGSIGAVTLVFDGGAASDDDSTAAVQLDVVARLHKLEVGAQAPAFVDTVDVGATASTGAGAGATADASAGATDGGGARVSGVLGDSAGADVGAAMAACARSDRPDGLFTTVVTDESGVALGLVYSSAESIREAVRCGRGVYYSRSRGGLWRKGDTSGAWQALIAMQLDCDSDALLFTVRQNGTPPSFCHTGSRTCWGDAGGLGALERVLVSRKAAAPAGSYTKRLFDDAELLRHKLLEEAQELAEAEEPDHVAAEAADVIYFALVRCAAAGVGIADVERHLDRRALKVKRRPGNSKPERIAAARAHFAAVDAARATTEAQKERAKADGIVAPE